MEIVGADGSRIRIKQGQTMELGRSQGLNSSDKTISRRHLTFFVPPFAQNQEPRLQFEVLGRNPVYVNRNGKVVVFRRFERAEMRSGDMFCCSAKDPVWYELRKTENCDSSVRGNDLAENSESDFGFNGVENLRGEGVDISDIDAVREFGFVVMGHEFDSYSKKIIRDLKNLNWFLEEARKDIEDGDEGKKGKGCGIRKRKKGEENDDEEWKGKSEDEKELITTRKKGQKAKYVTRSKDRSKQVKNASTSKNITRRDKDGDLDDDDDDEEEDDETLGGFIIDDEKLEAEEEEGEEEEEEEEEEEIEEEYGEDEDE